MTGLRPQKEALDARSQVGQGMSVRNDCSKHKAGGVQLNVQVTCSKQRRARRILLDKLTQLMLQKATHPTNRF